MVSVEVNQTLTNVLLRTLPYSSSFRTPSFGSHEPSHLNPKWKWACSRGWWWKHTRPCSSEIAAFSKSWHANLINILIEKWDAHCIHCQMKSSHVKLQSRIENKNNQKQGKSRGTRGIWRECSRGTSLNVSCLLKTYLGNLWRGGHQWTSQLVFWSKSAHMADQGARSLRQRGLCCRNSNGWSWKKRIEVYGLCTRWKDEGEKEKWEMKNLEATVSAVSEELFSFHSDLIYQRTDKPQPF